MFCTECGNRCRDGARFCNKCGAPLDSEFDKKTQDMATGQPDTYVQNTDESIDEIAVKRGRTAVVILSVTALVLLAAVVFAYLFLFTDLLKKKPENQFRTQTEQDAGKEAESDFAAQDDRSDKAFETKKEPEQTDPADSSDPDFLLEKELEELSYIDLNGLYYEHRMSASGSIYESNGLDRMGGTFKAYTLDPDSDSQYELLTFSLDYDDKENAHFITMDMYETEGNQVIKADSVTAVPCIFQGYQDSGDVKFFVKDNKYLCILSEALSFLEGDGASESMTVFTYNGDAFETYAYSDYMGSDWDNIGRSETEFCNRCKNIGLEKTASLLYSKDFFYFSTADEGLESMFKIRMEINGEFGDSVLRTDISFIDAAEETDYIFKDSSWRLISESELFGLTKEECRIARNEIYARNAWRFEDEGLAEYFKSKAWYHAPCGFENITDADLNETERSNIRLIKEAESER